MHYLAELLRSDTNQAYLERKKQSRMYESGKMCFMDVDEVRFTHQQWKKHIHREKKTEAHVKLDIKWQDTNRMMSMIKLNHFSFFFNDMHEMIRQVTLFYSTEALKILF